MRVKKPGRAQSFPTLGLGLAIKAYEVVWHLVLPLVLVMFWRRGAKEPLYRQFWNERFGGVCCTMEQPIWVHSASMGEMRGAAPWIQALLDHGFKVFLTTLTPAGRQTAQTIFSESIHKGELQLGFAPLELSWAVRRFLNRVQPRCGVMTEIDTWPVLLATASKAGLPLAIANAQYPQPSFERDLRWGGLRARLFQAYGLVMCKSDLQAQRFAHVGCTNIAVVGETRFDLPVSVRQLFAAENLVELGSFRSRPVVCFASVIEEEEAIFITTIQRMQEASAQKELPKPVFVYVPRSPQRFEAVSQQLTAHGLKTLLRSQALDVNLVPTQTTHWASIDVFLGDSIGEMFFYLALSQVVVVGSSFGFRAVHNIIEPLALNKPVWTGPSVRGIEYPAIEALAAGVLHHATDGEDLSNQLISVLNEPGAYAGLVQKTKDFNAAHAGAVDKHMSAFLPWLQEQGAG